MKRPAKNSLNLPLLRSRLKLKNLQAEAIFRSHHPEATSRFEALKVKPGKLRKHSSKLVTMGALSASMLLASGQQAVAEAPVSLVESKPTTSNNFQDQMKSALENVLPKTGIDLDSEKEEKVQMAIRSVYGIKATPSLDGNRLNHNFGFIGAEQHLPRFPGDSVEQHDEYQHSGLTPGRGAWGYFARSKSELTPEMVEKEKYYFAVQTLYLPDWNTRLPYLRDWYKHRKMIAVNPVNGKAIVGVVADSGPSWWTGKQFGGSPEVMGYLNMKDGKQRGRVVLYFVDDVDNKIPLGPVEYNLTNPPELVSI